jgi:membrane-associated HD superfamily phosphohydrolase
VILEDFFMPAPNTKVIGIVGLADVFDLASQSIN